MNLNQFATITIANNFRVESPGVYASEMIRVIEQALDDGVLPYQINFDFAESNLDALAEEDGHDSFISTGTRSRFRSSHAVMHDLAANIAMIIFSPEVDPELLFPDSRSTQHGIDYAFFHDSLTAEDLVEPEGGNPLDEL